MTGFACVDGEFGGRTVRMELRAVNGKGLKITCKSPDLGPEFESDVESTIRRQLRRGSVSLAIGINAGQTAVAPTLQLNREAFASLWQQIVGLSQELSVEPSLFASSLLQFPGVVTSSIDETAVDGLGAYIISQLELLITQFNEFRDREGASMVGQLLRLTAIIREHLKCIIVDSPRNIAAYREKLLERARVILETINIQAVPDELIREIAVIADKSDILEETTRLECHLAEFDRSSQSNDCEGRKLDFMCQEIFREINTIGSKANDFLISQKVIAMKSATEQIREIVQNIE